ncbi:MAG: D-alanine--D-alanine ligase [Phycisphaerae bacterium]|jgi:D-alanine-D-alanine ligase|nr:D-alanine--D-alanine ligase [Phycisphaerae bacterium]MBT5657727.1 D-alanine--D-alanine ligase [Phycisphaerae bacterium]
MSTRSIAVLMGGPDAERPVSIKSGHAVAKALTASGWSVAEHIIDRITGPELAALSGSIVFPVLHGPWGEGGDLQILLESDGRPYVGSPPKAAATCMDKDRTKTIAASLGIATPDWALLRQPEPCPLRPPVVIKPHADGSSIDLYLCDTQNEADAAVTTVIESHGAALVERQITGREMTVGIVNGQALPLIEIVPACGVYDFAAKYDRDDTQYLVNPSVNQDAAATMVEAALTLCQEVGARDIARVDFLLDENGPWLLEVNTMPGFTSHSLLPMAASAHGWDMPRLCDRLAHAAIARTITD